MSARRLSNEQRDEIVRRYASGENVTALSHEFGVDESYPGLLAQRRGVSLRKSADVRERMANAARARCA